MNAIVHVEVSVFQTQRERIRGCVYGSYVLNRLKV